VRAFSLSASHATKREPKEGRAGWKGEMWLARFGWVGQLICQLRAGRERLVNAAFIDWLVA